MSWMTNEHGTYLSQTPYIEKHLKLINVKHLSAGALATPGSITVGTTLYDQFRSALGKLIWLEKTRGEKSFDISMLASRVKVLSIAEIHYINDVMAYLLETKKSAVFIPELSLQAGEELQLVTICDASLGGRIDDSSQGARCIGLSTTGSDQFAPIEFVSRKVRRRGSSSFDVEMLTLIEASDMLMVIRLLLEELLYGARPSLMHRLLFEVEGLHVPRPPVNYVVDCDAKDCIERIYSVKDSLTISKRRRMDVTDAQDLLIFNDVTEFRHVHGPTNPLDVGTKKYGRYGISHEKASFQRYLAMLYRGEYIPDLTAVNRTSELNTAKIKYTQIQYLC
jgi:hypothetical protein